MGDNMNIDFYSISDDVMAIFSRRPYDINPKTISMEDINRQYSDIEKKVNYVFKKIINPNQNHTDVIGIVDDASLDDQFENTDGLVTNLKGVALVTRVADCQAILLYDSVNKVIANIHSGWRGTLKRIVKNAINIMINKYNSLPENIKVIICPSILKCCFEVDSDVKDLFEEEFTDLKISKYITKIDNKYHIDTVGINVDVMKSLGINSDNISLSNICTKCNSNTYHSYRADKEESGRNIALIAMK